MGVEKRSVYQFSGKIRDRSAQAVILSVYLRVLCGEKSGLDVQSVSIRSYEISA